MCRPMRMYRNKNNSIDDAAHRIAICIILLHGLTRPNEQIVPWMIRETLPRPMPERKGERIWLAQRV
jgi:hypothetical protein